MRSIRKRAVAMTAVAALSLGLAACGDDADTASEDTTTEDMADDMTDDMASDDMTDDMATDEMTDDMATDEMSDDMTESALTMEPVGPACDQIAADGEGSSEGMADDPVATAASNNPLLSTLVTAVGAADLVDTLNTAPALTVFAPINSAFEAFSEEELNGLLEDTETLTTVLTTHVAGEQLDADALAEAGTVTTLAENELTFDAENMTVTSPSGTEANVVCANVQTANATVHLIDAVLMP